MTYGVAHDNALTAFARCGVEHALVETQTRYGGIYPSHSAVALVTAFSPQTSTPSK